MKSKMFRYIAAVLLLIICFAVASGCGKKKEGPASQDDPVGTGEIINTPGPEEETANPESTVAPTDQTTNAPSDSSGPTSGKDNEDKEDPNGGNKVETTKLPIYTINDESLECESAVALIPKDTKITASVIVDAVVNSFADHGLEIGIDQITEEKDKVIVSFMSDKAPLFNVGSGVESAILDAVSQSLLDNLEFCKSVIFRVEGKAYESGHLFYEMDEPYSWK